MHTSKKSAVGTIQLLSTGDGCLLIELQLQEENSEPIALSRLLEYSQKALRLRHVNLPNVFEVGTQKSGHWALIRQAGSIAWMYLPELAGRLNSNQICSVLYSIADAVDYLYRSELRGGKTLNWIDFVRVAYDVRRSLTLAIVPPTPGDVDLVLQNKYCVLSPYTAPELLDSFSPTPAADSFAVACIGYQLFTGKPLVEVDIPGDFGSKLRNLEFASIQKILPEFPEELANCFESALRSTPDRRPTLRMWMKTLAKHEGHSLPLGMPEEEGVEFQKSGYVFDFTNVLHGVPVRFKKLAQAGETPMNVLMLSEVEDGKYTLNLPGSNTSLPEYCPLCGSIGAPPIHFCSACGHPLT